MSQLLNHVIAHICNRLISVVGLVCVAATTIVSQQAETIKIDQPITCDAKEYQVRLVSASALVGTRNASTLAIVLTPADASESKVFGVYWTDPTSPLPTYRDNTDGTLANKLLPYGKGVSKSQEPIVDDFFSTLKCSASDSQVSGIQKIMATQNLLDTLKASPITLQNIVEQLRNYGVAVSPEQIQQASTGNLDLFRDLSDETAFAKAIRQQVSNLFAAEGRSDQVSHKPTTQEEIAKLVAKNKDLEDKVKKADEENSGFFGAAPGWLVVAFPFMSVLSLVGLALSGLAVHSFVRERKSAGFGGVNAALSRLKSQNEQPLSLDQIITSARERKQSIENKYGSPDKNQKGKGRDASRNRADEWAQAYIDLQGQLEGLPKNVSSRDSFAPPHSTSSPNKSISTTDPEIILKLSEIATGFNDLKRNVEQVEVNIEQRFEGARALHEIWNRLYSRAYPRQLPENFTRDVGDVIQLYKSLSEHCGKRAESFGDTISAVRHVITELHSIREGYLANSLDENARLEQIVGRIKVKMDQDADSVRELNAIRQLLSTYLGRDVKAKDSVSRLIDEQSTAQQKLQKYHRAADFPRTVDAVVSSYESILRDTDHLLPEQTSSIPDRVGSLAREYRNLKPKADRADELEATSKSLQTQLDVANSELLAGKTLVDEIALELNFKNDSINHPGRITTTLNRLRDERTSSPYLQLRMGLSSAMMALEKASSANGSAEHGELMDALFLNNVKKGLNELLSRMEECSGAQLWTDVLYEGFNQQWLHYLLRADLLLRTYYSSRNEFSLLRNAVSLASTSILAALHDFQVEIVEVGLFEELPANMETQPVYPGLRNLPAVMEKVGLMVQNIKAVEVVVDVTSFPVFVKGVQKNRGRAAIANPSAWLQH